MSNWQNLFNILFIGGFCLGECYTHSDWIIRVWGPDMNNNVFDIGYLVKTDDMFGL